MIDICIRCDFAGVKCGRGCNRLELKVTRASHSLACKTDRAQFEPCEMETGQLLNSKIDLQKQFEPTIFGRCRCLANFAIGCKGRTSDRIQNHCVIQRLDVSVVESSAVTFT